MLREDLKKLCDILRPVRAAINVLQADNAIFSDVYFTLHPIYRNIAAITAADLPSEAAPHEQRVVDLFQDRISNILTDAHVRCAYSHLHTSTA
jgi:hypothetical protein